MQPKYVWTKSHQNTKGRREPILMVSELYRSQISSNCQPHTHRHTHGAQHSQAGMSDTISLIGHERMLDFPGGRVASGSPRQTGSAEWKRGRERWGRETELNYITPTLTAGCDIEEKLSVLMLSLRFCHVPLVDARIKLSVLSTECCPTNTTLWS